MEKFSEIEKNYKEEMEKNNEQLKKLSDDFARTSIELDLTNKTIHCGGRDELEIIGEEKLYITYLGYIDSLLIDLRSDIEMELAFEDYVEVAKKENKYKKIMNKRNELVRLIKENTNIFEYFDFAEQIINKVPSLSEFGMIYDNILSSRRNLNTKLEFISAYNHGCREYQYASLENMNEIFNECHNDLREHRLNNEHLVSRTVLTKKFIR